MTMLNRRIMILQIHVHLLNSTATMMLKLHNHLVRPVPTRDPHEGRWMMRGRCLIVLILSKDRILGPGIGKAAAQVTYRSQVDLMLIVISQVKQCQRFHRYHRCVPTLSSKGMEAHHQCSRVCLRLRDVEEVHLQ